MEFTIFKFFFIDIEKNAAPVARIVGGNQNISLPLSVLVLNGSLSSDDLAIVNYSWAREGDSLAIGTVIANSEHESVLMVSTILYIYLES